MKKIVLIAALTLTASAPTFASENCSLMAEMASVIMEKRLNGVTMRQMMEISDDKLAVQMVTEAYEQPAYRTEGMKTRAIQDFENKWYLRCVKALNK